MQGMAVGSLVARPQFDRSCFLVLLGVPPPHPKALAERGAGLVAYHSTMKQLALNFMVSMEVRDSADSQY